MTERPPALPRQTAEGSRAVSSVKSHSAIEPSKSTKNDWQFGDSVTCGAFGLVAAIPPSVDLRSPWWTINSQEGTGSCVGWATADGVVLYHMVMAARITPDQLLSPRHVWMASRRSPGKAQGFVALPASPSAPVVTGNPTYLPTWKCMSIEQGRGQMVDQSLVPMLPPFGAYDACPSAGSEHCQ
jgi:hypothetical protein